MIKAIYAYGDSFVAGDGVDPDQAWPIILGKRLNVQVHNRGCPGGSNRLSIINFLNDFADIKKPREAFIAFSWTGIMRTAFYHKGLETWRNVLVGHDPKDSDLKRLQELWYGEMYNDYDGQFDFYSQQIFISSFLESRKVKYIFVNSFIEDYIDKEAFRKQYKNLVKLLPTDKFMLGYDSSIYDLFCKRLKMTCSDGYHPSVLGHEKIADIAELFMRENKII